MTLNQHSSKWRQTSGYFEHGKETYPYHVHGSDQKGSSLSVVLKETTINSDYLCSGGTQGFIVAIHSPNEIPQMSKNSYYLPLQQTVSLLADPYYIITSENVQAHDLTVRQCYRDDERPLRFFKQYNSRNCRVECLSNFTLAQCGCVKFSMPSKPFHRTHGQSRHHLRLHFQGQLEQKFVHQPNWIAGERPELMHFERLHFHHANA